MRRQLSSFALGLVLTAACSSGEPASSEAAPAPAPAQSPKATSPASEPPTPDLSPGAPVALVSVDDGFVVARAVELRSVIERYDAAGALVWSTSLGDAERPIAARALAAVGEGPDALLLAVVEQGPIPQRRVALEWLRAASGEPLPERPRLVLESDDQLASAYGLSFDPGGGWMIAGSQDHDMAVWKIDADGHTRWRHSYGGPGPDKALAIAPSPDGSWRLGGRCAGAKGEPGDCLLAIEDDGSMRWNKRYGADHIAAARPLTQQPGHVVAGTREGRLWVAWIDEAGARIREQSLDHGKLRSLSVDADGQITLAGHHLADPSSPRRGWLATLGPEGKLVAERDLGPELVEVVELVEIAQLRALGAQPNTWQLYVEAPKRPRGAVLCAVDERLLGCELSGPGR